LGVIIKFFDGEINLFFRFIFSQRSCPIQRARLVIFLMIFRKRQTEAVFSHGKDQAAQAEAALESMDFFVS
jgi:hypothetical protein